MSVHERLFDVFKNGSRDAAKYFVDLEDQKRIREEEKHARIIKHCALCSRKVVSERCKLTNQEHSTFIATSAHKTA